MDILRFELAEKRLIASYESAALTIRIVLPWTTTVILDVRYFLDSNDDWYYFKTIEEAAKHVSAIVGHEVEATVKAIDEALEDYLEEHEDEDIFYSFHEFKIIGD